MSSNSLVPFGKYKGQPVEVLANEPSYVDWLKSQDFVRTNYPQFHTIIVNNFCEPSETPEHNAMQARFLDPMFCLRFLAASNPSRLSSAESSAIECLNSAAKQYRSWQEAVLSEVLKHEERISKRRLDIIAANCGRATPLESILRKRITDEDAAFPRPSVEQLPGPKSLALVSVPQFENKSIDVSFKIHLLEFEVNHRAVPPSTWTVKHVWNLAGRFSIEIKPCVGDDYPAVIRQMRRMNCSTLFLREYTGSGVDKNTFLFLMTSQGLKVIFESDVDSINLPDSFISGIPKIDAKKYFTQDLSWIEKIPDKDYFLSPVKTLPYLPYTLDDI